MFMFIKKILNIFFYNYRVFCLLHPVLIQILVYFVLFHYFFLLCPCRLLCPKVVIIFLLRLPQV